MAGCSRGHEVGHAAVDGTPGAADELTIANDDTPAADYRRFLTAAGRLKPGGGSYVWHADAFGSPVRRATADTGLGVRQCLVWVTPGLALGRQDYHWWHEPCLYGWAHEAAHTWPADRTQTTVPESDTPARTADHPAMKPVALFAYLIATSCPGDGAVLDAFGGAAPP